MGDRRVGLVRKFIVKRADGTHRSGGKHENCEYFVLDLTHDPHAIPALEAYAKSCLQDGYIDLANDLYNKVHALLKVKP